MVLGAIKRYVQLFALFRPVLRAAFLICFGAVVIGVTNCCRELDHSSSKTVAGNTFGEDLEVNYWYWYIVCVQQH